MSTREVFCLTVLMLNAAAFATGATAADAFTIHNHFAIAYERQPLEVSLDTPVIEPGHMVVDEHGQVAGQVSRDGRRAFLAIGFPEGQTSRQFTVKQVADPRAGIANPVTLVKKVWTTEQGQASGTVYPNGVAEYYEISNGLCGVRVPASLLEGALPAVRVPTPVIGIQHKDGEWAGRPDFRSLVVPAKSAWNGDIIREDWRFTSFASEVVEEGPIRTTVRMIVGTDERSAPYTFTITVYADEKFIKISQENGFMNRWGWFLDLNLDKPTWWRATRWRSGANHHWYGDGAGPEQDYELLGRPGRKYDLKWSAGPGPTKDPKIRRECAGEGEGDLFAHDAWIDFWGGQWGKDRLCHRGVSDDTDTWMLSLRGQVPWYPWNGVGQVLYAFDRDGSPQSPVVGLLTGPAGEITGWDGGGNPPGIVNFSQHLPAWQQEYPYVIPFYLEDWRYDGVRDKTKPILGVKFVMPMTTGSVFVWIGENSDIIPDINDPRIDLDYVSKPWRDWARYTNGAANLQDNLAYTPDWPEPPTYGTRYTEEEIVSRTISRVRAGEHVGDWPFWLFWRIEDHHEQTQAVDRFITHHISNDYDGIRARINRSRASHWGVDGGHLAWYTFEREVAVAMEEMELYFALGRQADGGLLTDEQWKQLKLIASFYFHHTFDEDRACLWNANTTINHGGGTMLSPAINARLGIINGFSTWPDAEPHADRVVNVAEATLLSQIGRYGAQFTSTHYSTLAAITGALADLQALQYRSYTDPAVCPDEYARDPRLRHHAYFVLNRTGVKDPRNGNVRMPIAVGNAGPGWGMPAAALLSAGFRHLDPKLSRQLMWAWVASGKSTQLTPPLPKMLDYDTPPEPYPFPPVASFPGVMTVHRSAPHTEFETGVWIVDGAFFNQHREPAESGEVHIDALGKPLVTNVTTYTFPSQPNPFYKNVIGTVTANWDADSHYWGEPQEPWTSWSDQVLAVGSFPHGSYSCSLLTSSNPSNKGLNWQRQIALVRPDVQTPVIVIRDVLSQPGDYTVTFWLQTEGEIATPGGRITPPVKSCPQITAAEVTAAQSPSAVKVPGPLPAGANIFSFRGHDWLKLYPKSYEQAKITDVGKLVDVEVTTVNPGSIEAVVGHWRTVDGAARLADQDGRIDDRQYLRVKFSGTSHVTIFVPYFRGQRPVGLKVGTAGEKVVIKYTSAAGAKREIVVSPTGYVIRTNGKPSATETFPTGMPQQLYPQWDDLPYGGQTGGWGSPLPIVEVANGQTWANGTYEQLPHAYLARMLCGKDGLRDPFARYGVGARLDESKPCFRQIGGDRLTYIFALAGRGYLLTRLPGTPGSATEQWLWADHPDAASPEAVSAWRLSTTDYGEGLASTPVSGMTVTAM